MYFQSDEQLSDYLAATFPREDNDIVIMDGYPEAVVSIVEDPYTGTIRLVYSVEGILSCLLNRGMSMSDAIDYYDYNISRGLDYLNKAGPMLQYQSLPQNPVKAKETGKEEPPTKKNKRGQGTGKRKGRT